MAKQIINTGTSANSKNGESIRSAFTKVNANFTELYTLVGNGSDTTVSTGTTPPSSPMAGSLWWNTDDGRMYIRYNDAWVDTSIPSGSGSSASDRLTNGSYELVLSSTGHTTMPGGIVFDNGRSFYNPTNNGINFWDGPETGPYNGEIALDVDGVWLFSNNEQSIWRFDNSGSINTPASFPRTFTATLDTAHLYPYPGDGVEMLVGPPWTYDVTFSIGPDGSVNIQCDGNRVWNQDVYLQDGYVFRFTDADHGFTGYTLDITLDRVNAGPAGWAGQLTFTPPPSFPATIKAPNIIKLSSSNDINVSVVCYIGATDELIAYDTAPHISDVQVGWTVDVDGTVYTVTSIPSGYPAGQYRLDVAGATFTSGHTYTFTSPVKNWLFDSNGVIRLPNGGDIVDAYGTSVLGGGSSVSISDFGDGFGLDNAGKFVTRKLYSTNETNSAQHYRLELDTNGVVVLPDQSIINGATLRVTPGTGELNYAALAAGPSIEQPEQTWMWVDHNGAWVETDFYGTGYVWQFGNDGTFNLPLTSDSSGIVQTTGHIKINANGNIWKFDLDGDLHLPAGGDILDSNGDSVLGGMGGNPFDQSLNSSDNVQFATVSFPTSGLGDPTVSTRSVGTKLVIWPEVQVSGHADYAIGMADSVLWQTVPTTGQSFKWYGGATLALTVKGNGNIIPAGSILAKSGNGTTGLIFSPDGATSNGSISVDSSYVMTVAANGGFHVSYSGNERLAITSQDTTLTGGNDLYIKSNKNTSEFSWKFDTTGKLITPGEIWTKAGDGIQGLTFSPNGTDSSAYIKVDGGQNTMFQSNGNMYLRRGANDRLAITNTKTTLSAASEVELKCYNGGDTWTFGSGLFIMSNGSVQNTGYWVAETAPTSSKGSVGDTSGWVAFDSGNFYYCKYDYSSTYTYIITGISSTTLTVATPRNLPVPAPGWTFDYDGTTYTVATVTPTIYGDVELEISQPGFNPVDNVTLTPITPVDIWVKTAWTSTSW